MHSAESIASKVHALLDIKVFSFLFTNQDMIGIRSSEFHSFMSSDIMHSILHLVQRECKTLSTRLQQLVRFMQTRSELCILAVERRIAYCTLQDSQADIHEEPHLCVG